MLEARAWAMGGAAGERPERPPRPPLSDAEKKETLGRLKQEFGIHG